MRRRGLPRLKGRCTSGSSATAVGDEGGFAPDLDSNEEALRDAGRGDRGRRLPARRGGRDRARPGHERDLPGRRLLLEHEGRTLERRRAGRLLGDLAARYPILSIEDGMAEEDWDGWKALTERLGEHGAARRRRPVRDQHRAPARGIERGSGQLDPDQGQPDRHAHRDPRRRSRWRGGRIYGGHVATARARPRT